MRRRSSAVILEHSGVGYENEVWVLSVQFYVWGQSGVLLVASPWGRWHVVFVCSGSTCLPPPSLRAYRCRKEVQYVPIFMFLWSVHFVYFITDPGLCWYVLTEGSAAGVVQHGWFRPVHRVVYYFTGEGFVFVPDGVALRNLNRGYCCAERGRK